MSNFYFVLTNPEAEPLLKLEMGELYPDLKLSYSRPGFLTFKGGDRKVAFNPHLCRVSGLCLGKQSLTELLKHTKAWVYKLDAALTLPPALTELSDRSLFKVGEKVTLIIAVSTEEYWVGEYELLRTHFQTPGEVSSILPKTVPSRAYYKLAEAFEAFDLDFNADQTVLELGAAPGGASLFMLDQGMQVIGVDPAQMNTEVLSHKNFRHIAKPFETLTQASLPEEIDWIISDVNLPPTVVIKELERLLDFLDPVGIIVNLKLNQNKHVKSLAYFRQTFRKRGFDQVELKYLPSHRKEIALIAIHS
jgi:23S rRNA (cytidine2498-2'-O)-methyltransferase